jgi:TraM recognition site of TraD and TraG
MSYGVLAVLLTYKLFRGDPGQQMGEHSPAGPSDAHRLARFLTALAVPVALTPIGIISASVALMIFRFFGRRTVAVWMAIVALLFLLERILTGECRGFWQAYWQVYLHPLLWSEFFQGEAAWERLFSSPTIAQVVTSLGIFAGCLCQVIAFDKANSAFERLKRGEVATRRPVPPFTRLLRMGMALRASSRNGAVVIGTEFESGREITISSNDRSKHLLIVGTTGAGKTVSIKAICKSDIDCGHGGVFIDGKGDAALGEELVNYARTKGRKAYLFDATQQFTSDVYNPFAHGDHSSLADRVVTLREWSESFYQTEATGYAQMAFYVLRSVGQPIDLVTLSDAFNTGFLYSLIRRHKSLLSNPQELSDLVTEQIEAEKNTQALRSEIRNLSRSALRPLFDTVAAGQAQVLDLKRAREERAFVYFALPSLTYPGLAGTLGKLILNDCKAAAATSRTIFPVYVDEFGAFAGRNVLNLVNMGRTFSVRGVLAVQTLGDLSVTPGGDAFTDQVLASTNTCLVHRLNAPSDAERLAGYGGTETTVGYTARTTNSVATGEASARFTQEFLIHPDELKRLSVGEAFLINKNSGRADLIKVRETELK